MLSELRQRASIVLSASGIVASLLGASALEDGDPRVWIWAALAVTTVSILLCVWVLKSVSDTGAGREWRVTVSADELRDIVAGRLRQDQVLEELMAARKTNFKTIAARSRVFLAACALLPLQIVCWALVLL